MNITKPRAEAQVASPPLPDRGGGPLTTEEENAWHHARQQDWRAQRDFAARTRLKASGEDEASLSIPPSLRKAAFAIGLSVISCAGVFGGSPAAASGPEGADDWRQDLVVRHHSGGGKDFDVYVRKVIDAGNGYSATILLEANDPRHLKPRGYGAGQERPSSNLATKVSVMVNEGSWRVVPLSVALADHPNTLIRINTANSGGRAYRQFLLREVFPQLHPHGDKRIRQGYNLDGNAYYGILPPAKHGKQQIWLPGDRTGYGKLRDPRSLTAEQLKHALVLVKNPRDDYFGVMVGLATAMPELAVRLRSGASGGSTEVASYGDPDPAPPQLDGYASGPRELYREDDDGGHGKRVSVQMEIDAATKGIDLAALSVSLAQMDAADLAAFGAQVSGLSWVEQAKVFKQVVAGTWTAPGSKPTTISITPYVSESSRGKEVFYPFGNNSYAEEVGGPKAKRFVMFQRRSIQSTERQYDFVGWQFENSGQNGSSADGIPLPDVAEGEVRIWRHSSNSLTRIYQLPGGEFWLYSPGAGFYNNGVPREVQNYINAALAKSPGGAGATAEADRVKANAQGYSRSSSGSSSSSVVEARALTKAENSHGLYDNVSSQADADAANRRAAPEMNELESRSAATQQEVKAAVMKVAADTYKEMKSNGASDNEAADAATAAAQAEITRQVEQTRPTPPGEGDEDGASGSVE